MNYKGYTIIKTSYGQWKVLIGMSVEILATSENDARCIVDDIIKKDKKF